MTILRPHALLQVLTLGVLVAFSIQPECVLSQQGKEVLESRRRLNRQEGRRRALKKTKKSKKSSSSSSYEVWASDQSNSVPDEASPGVNGSYLWIWDSADIKDQMDHGIDAVPLSCTPNSDDVGPCDLWDVFPLALNEVGDGGVMTGLTLADVPKFGRLHGMLKDPQARYVTTNMYTPGKVQLIEESTI